MDEDSKWVRGRNEGRKGLLNDERASVTGRDEKT